MKEKEQLRTSDKEVVLCQYLNVGIIKYIKKKKKKRENPNCGHAVPSKNADTTLPFSMI